MRVAAPDAAGLALAAHALGQGGVVVCPTETVYGLAVDPFNPEAMARLFAVKGRPETNPVLLVVADRDQLDRLVQAVSPAAEACMAAHWPGPLSLLFPARDGLHQALTAGSGRVCVRCPACQTARALCAAFGGPLTSTSANRTGEPPARMLAELAVEGVTLALDGGLLAGSLPSTVYDPDARRVLREGAIPARALTTQAADDPHTHAAGGA